MIFCTECDMDIDDMSVSCCCHDFLNWSVFNNTEVPEFSLVLPRNQYFLNFDLEQIFYLDNDRAIVLNE